MTHSSSYLKLYAALLMLLVVGCTQTESHQSIERTVIPDADPSVLLMPPDILLQELTASGLTITNAAWTESGENNVSQALNISMQTRGVDLTRYVEDNPSIESATLESHQQIVKLHEAVGNTILLHKYRQYFSLPTKEGRFDWTLSKEVQSLRDEYKADYALFVFMRDTFSSGSRVALMVAMAILGVPVSGGYQIGFASLVDLDSGDIVWFNLLTSGTGDLRDPARASDAVELLLSDFPI